MVCMRYVKIVKAMVMGRGRICWSTITTELPVYNVTIDSCWYKIWTNCLISADMNISLYRTVIYFTVSYLRKMISRRGNVLVFVLASGMVFSFWYFFMYMLLICHKLNPINAALRAVYSYFTHKTDLQFEIVATHKCQQKASSVGQYMHSKWVLDVKIHESMIYIYIARFHIWYNIAQC